MAMRVIDVRPVADRIVEVLLDAAEGTRLPSWQPGAHVELVLKDGLIRQYSLCGTTQDGQWRIAVLLQPASRGGSWHVHHHLRAGDLVQVGAVRNRFPFTPGTRRVLFVAGGIGITPILPMLEAAEAASADWTLLYLVRDRNAAAFLAELEILAEKVHLHSDSTSGRVDLEGELNTRGGATADIYGCGPQGLLDSLGRYGVAHPDARLFVERFSARKTETAGQQLPFTVVTSDGSEFEVPAGQSIPDAAADVGITIPSSCREGYYGTCELKVVAGEPDHRDDFLSEEERADGRSIMPCVSRAVGPRIVLEL